MRLKQLEKEKEKENKGLKQNPFEPTDTLIDTLMERAIQEYVEDKMGTETPKDM
jgi:hypothetical protein